MRNDLKLAIDCLFFDLKYIALFDDWRALRFFFFFPCFPALFFWVKYVQSQPQGRDIADNFNADVRHSCHNAT